MKPLQALLVTIFLANTFTTAQHGIHNTLQSINMSNDMLTDLEGQDLEVTFLSMMIEHHKSAIEMSNWILDISTNPELIDAAKSIITAQAPEIMQMTQWLDDWFNQGIDEASAMMMQSEIDLMMESMKAAEDPEKAFLYQMSLHHNSAIDMAQSILLKAVHPELRELAKNIIITQSQEIFQYQNWLNGLSTSSQEHSTTSYSNMSHNTTSHNNEVTYTSPYIDQRDSSIRGLSQEEIDGLLAGEGMGYARSAELNGYPGPRHVLDLANELQLTSEQTTSITTIFDDMKYNAVILGQAIVDAETLLSQAFAKKTISDKQLEEKLTQLTTLYNQLRQVHLQAHLAVTPLLTNDQQAQYQILRGYKN